MLDARQRALADRFFEEALALPPEKQADFLAQDCHDPDVRREVESLLAFAGPSQVIIRETLQQVAKDLMGSGVSSLAVGAQLGRYRIEDVLGAGGMGRVYKAHDSRLGRTVAIKVCVAQFTDRFEREVRAIGALNHPNICTLHDVGQEEDFVYLVMEYLQGETLAERLKRGPLPAGELMEFAMQIAGALQAAHSADIIHRDIKPANVFLTRSGQSKVLDFGVAKLHSRPDESGAPTRLTATGATVGTVAYMSPEQARGSELDSRTDLFSFGVVLYEMATGRQAFTGKTPVMIQHAILHSEPASVFKWNPDLPAEWERIIHKLLEKDRKLRYQTAADLQADLHRLKRDADSRESKAAVPVMSGPHAGGLIPNVKKKAIWLAAVLAVILATLPMVLRWNAAPAQQTALTRFTIFPPPGHEFFSAGNVSPDSRVVAFVSRNQNGDRVIWLRSLDGLDAKLLAGTEGVLPPFFWAPDSKQIGFFTSTHLKKVSVADGTAQTLTEVRPFASGASGGGSWSPDGTILFVPGGSGPLFRISADGGVPSPATTLNETEEYAHVWPSFLPDGKHFLYEARTRNSEKTAIYAGLLGSMDRKRILDGNTFAAYAPPGYLLFSRGDKLLAQVFNAARLELSGDPIVVASGLKAVGAYSVSQNGVLVVWSAPASDKTQLTWFGRKGEWIASLGSPDVFYNPVLSPSGRDIAVERLQGGKQNIWLSNAQRGLVRFTVDGPYDGTPVWSLDGRYIAFTTESSSSWTIRRKGIGGQTESEDLSVLKRESYTTDWSPDGQFIAYESHDPETGWDCWLLPLTGDGKPQPLLKTSSDERQLQFSPDGHWIAYTSNLSSRNEVYVQRLPISGPPRPISNNGGAQPRWSRNGRELFYIAPDRTLMAVPIKTSPALEVGSPTALFQTHVPVSQILDGSGRDYDVSPDGQRLLVNSVVESPMDQFTVILNWTAALKPQ